MCMFCSSLFVQLLLAFVLSVLRFMDSDYLPLVSSNSFYIWIFLQLLYLVFICKKLRSNIFSSHNGLRVNHRMTYTICLKTSSNCIGCVMASMLAWSVVNPAFEPRSCQTKNNKIGICCFSVEHTAIRRKSKSGWLRIRICLNGATSSTQGLLFQWASIIKI